MGACAAVSTAREDPCGAIPCILRQCVHNKDDYNEDDHIGFPFQFSRRRRMDNTMEWIQSHGGRGGCLMFCLLVKDFGVK